MVCFCENYFDGNNANSVESVHPIDLCFEMNQLTSSGRPLVGSDFTGS